ncbi:MAG: insulinase family protein [Oscillospiraceae bacterium]|nr:insulinase family protein [Oscillospiraceae bacterium]
MIQEIISSRIGEKCYKYIHSSGVTICLCPMESYSTVNAQFAVKFGSEDCRYRLNGGDVKTIPDGTAHYLEHKLFESPEKDAFALFAETGASCNAVTSYDSTCYYFSCAENFERNLEILLDFVQSPHFTPENVEKERGIISQEITMYLDNPGWRVIMELLKGVYSVNPIRTDIAGSVESIAEITDKTLYDVYEAFYNPSNMYISIAGNFDMDKAIEVCERCLLPRQSAQLETIACEEPYEVAESRRVMQMPVAKPQFAIGFKRPDADGQEALDEYIYLNTVMDILFGDTSEFYKRMRDSGALNDTFRVSVFMGRGYVLPLVTGESDDPDAVLSEMKKEIRRFKEQLPDKEHFERIRKMNYGYIVRGYNNTESVSQAMLSMELSGLSPYAMVEGVAESCYEEMCRRLLSIDEENSCIAIINPLDGGK